jgi:CRISPR-associated protein Csd1
MILASLVAMAEREGLTASSAFENKPVKWVISLDGDGRFLGLTDTLSDTAEIEGKKKPKPIAKVMSIPRQSVRSGINPPPYFLIDKSEYVLGIEPDGKRAAAELEKRRGLFLEQIQTAYAATGNVELQAAVNFLSGETRRAECVARLEEKGYASNDLFTFEVEDEMLHENPDICSYWTNRQDAITETTGDFARQCVVCGREGATVRLHDQVSGLGKDKCALVSFNETAFLKYNLEGNDNAPVCGSCMTAYVESIRRCLSDRYPRPDYPDEAFPKQSVRLTAETMAIFWADAPFGVVSELAHLSDRPADVKAMLESPWGGQQPGSLKTERFHCLVITGARGRATIRGLHTGTLGGLVVSLKRYFDCLAMPGSKVEEPMPVHRLLRSMSRQPKPPAKPVDPPVGLAKDLFLAAVLSYPLPRRVLSGVVARNVAERKVTLERAALLHLYFELQINTEKPPMSLDVNCTEPAYRLGRLLAVLEAIQYQAQGRLKRNIINRFYGAASTRPGAVFPILIKGAQPHLAKLPTGGRNHWSRELGLVLDEILNFNPMLSLDEQGRFALGYYQQRQEHFKKYEKPSKQDNGEVTSDASNDEGEDQ